VGVIKTSGSAANATLAATLYNVYADQINTPRVITRQSDEAIVWRWDSAEAFGASAPDQNPNALGTFTFNQRFPGQLFDAESGLSQNWNREYNARTGRYVQSDPIGLKGGINTYGYTEGNPVANTDPYGLYTEIIQWGQSPGLSGSWGHISGNINGQNFSFGKNGWDTRFPLASDYADRQKSPDIDRAGQGIILKLSPLEEAKLGMCVRKFSNYDSLKNNCGNPWLQCLDEIGITKSGNRPNILPSDVLKIIGSSPRAVGNTSYPGTRPLYVGH
jgi:RHS repeat-associated protein